MEPVLKRARVYATDAMNRYALSREPLIKWTTVDHGLGIYGGDVPCVVGDCMFACVAWWLNCCHGRTMFTPMMIRMLTAAAAHNHLYYPHIDIVEIAEELSFDLGHCIAPTDIPAAFLCQKTWGNNSTLELLANILRTIYGIKIGFVIIQTDMAGLVHPEPICIPSCVQEIAIACVLVHVNDNHYNVACYGDTWKFVSFQPRTKEWIEKWIALNHEAD